MPGRRPIAIVGMGCRFPGADNPAELWNLLKDRRSAVGVIPEDRMGPLDEIFAEQPATPGKIMSRFGGYLKNLDRLDARFFGIAPREAALLDPQQRLLLEVAWEALEDAGQPVADLHGSSTGVYIGSWLQDFETRLLGDPTSADLSEIDFYTTTGSGRYNLSGRLSYFFGWQGPSVTLDTACSSSLVSIHLACNALHGGECEVALAGGVNVILTPYITVAYSQSRMMAQDGRCKFGDATGDGYVRSEGCGLLVLKTLEAARAAGDRIYAVIEGSAVNNDGRTSGFLATPGVEGQADLLRKAYAAAGLDPASVDYVEAHGTGTAAGDPVELEAIGQVLAAGRNVEAPCLVGSIKTNLGHTEGAAGVAGVIKTALALHRSELPASLHLVTPNPKIDWSGWKLKVPTESQPWIAGAGRRIAGVSAFGISGTNAHIVLADDIGPQRESVEGKRYDRSEADSERLRLVPLSAGTPAALRELAERWASALPDLSSDVGFLGHVRGAAMRRSALDVRAAVLASNATQLRERLLQYAANPDGAEGVSSAEPGVPVGKIVFVFPGQGSQWLGMARQLLREEPVFQQSMERIAHAMVDELERPLLELLADPEPIEKIHWVQPALFAIEVALADLWRSWGVEPDAVIGHSMGEAAAAAVAGSISLEDACKVICRRSRLMLRQSGQGLMTVVELSLDEAREALGPFQNRLSVAVNNSPRSCVISGEPAAMAELVAQLEARDVYCRAVKVDVASHSPQMDPLKADLEEALGSVRGRAGSVPVYSTVDGEPTDGAHFDVNYWVRNLRQPVLFSGMIGRLVADGHTTFIEMSAHPILLPAVQQNLDALGVKGLTLASMRRDEDERAVALASLGRLFAAGFDLDWSRTIPAGDTWETLPLYPWERERFWYHDAGPMSRPAAKSSSGRRHVGSHPDLHSVSQAIDRPAEWYFDLSLAEALDLGSPAGLASQWEWLLAAGQAVTVSSSAPDPADGVSGELEDWKANLAAPHKLDRLQIRVRRRGRKSLEMALLGGSQVIATARWNRAVGAASRLDDGRWLDVATIAATLTERLGEDETVVRVARFGLSASEAVGVETAPRPADPEALAFGVDWILDESTGSRDQLRGRWIVLSAPSACASVDALVRRLGQAGAEVVSVESALAASSAALAVPTRGVIVALSAAESADPAMQDPAAHGSVAEQVLDRLSPLRTLAAALAQRDGVENSVTPRLFVVGFGRTQDPSVAAAFAFARAMNFEITDLRATTLDLAETPDEDDWRGVIAELAGERDDRRVRLRNGERRTARLVGASSKRRRFLATVATDAPWSVFGGSLGDEVPFVEIAPRSPEDGDVVVTVEAAGWAEGKWTVAFGVVREIGTGVTACEVGDRVCGVPRLDSHVLLSSEVTMRAVGLRNSGEETSGVAALQQDSQGALADADVVSLMAFVDDGVSDQARRLIRFDSRPTRLAAPDSGVRPSATYWITGGLGALGRGVAERWVALGARHLVLTGRSEPGVEAQADIQRWQRAGVEVRTFRCDVADADSVARVLATIDGELPTLAGVFHVAGVLDDGLIVNLTDDQFRNVFGPKISGSVNLHRLLHDRPLDHFVLFGSAVGVLGTAGQANYVAANAYMDALAHQRREEGQAALAMDWGPWSEVGLAAARSDRGDRLESQGLAGLAPSAGWAVFERYVNADSPQVVGMQFDASRWSRTHVSASGDPFLADWIREAPEESDGNRDELLGLLESAGSTVARRGILRDFVQRHVAAVLRSDPNRIESTRPFRALGFDSLMTLELRNRLEPPTGLKLSATMVWNYPNVQALADFLLGRLEATAEASDEASGDVSSAQETVDSRPAVAPSLDERAMEAMSEAEAEALLAAKMAELENLP